MKFFIAILALAAVTSAQHLQQKPISILRQAQDHSPEGAYSYSYETENGIAVGESGAPTVPGEEGLAVSAQGSFQYTSPEGIPIALNYVADENGFQPQGAHLPVPPPIPEAIQRSIQLTAARPQFQEPLRRG